jgi:hypothetical protein
MLILGSSEYLTTQLDRLLRDFVGVMLFEWCLDLMTTSLDGVVTPGQLDLPQDGPVFQSAFVPPPVWCTPRWIKK